jgi:hypothetical protein
MAKRYDEDESILRTLKDGERMHFSMMTMDSEVLPARDAGTTAPLRVVDVFGNSGLALNKPGSRYLTAGKHTPDHAALVMCDHQRRESMFNSFAMPGKALAPATAKLHACTAPAMLFATPTSTKNSIWKILGTEELASDEQAPHHRAAHRRCLARRHQVGRRRSADRRSRGRRPGC